ncbi:MAG: polysaccharide biosynthesis/export family protein [Leptolyngbyaceae cyanobacterium bins.59]|nr:polysaccharide biosynthesis/export family protein [Leptolyngbyaceae cyanobacterium bins.59]
MALPLSPGDYVRISIPEGDDFNGIFTVNQQGNLEIPYLQPLPVAGLETSEVEQSLYQALVKGGFFRPAFLRVSVRVVQWGEAVVAVSGAVFAPGQVLINPQTTADKTQSPLQIAGDYAPARNLTNAIRNAGGVRPDADLKSILLIRKGQEYRFDLSGILLGEPVPEVPLITGDQIKIASTGKVQPELVRPSTITTVGVKVFLSNLTEPSSSNASSSIGRDATSFPYGARFAQAVVAANCAGGTQATNADRQGLLVRIDRLTGKTWYLERSVQDLLKNSTGEENNPFLMPDDAVICYDSAVTNTRDIFQTIGDIFSPFAIIRGLFR